MKIGSRGKILLVLIGLLCLFALNFLFTSVIEEIDNGAPGCQSNRFSGFGGCGAKFKITDVKLEPQIDCLKLDVNNCHNPSLELKSTCGKIIVNFDCNFTDENRHECQPNTGNSCIQGDPTTSTGEYVKRITYENQCAPPENKNYTVKGIVNNQEFTLYYTVTKELC